MNMEVPSDGSVLANTTPPGNFHQHFRRCIGTLQEQVDSLALVGASTSDRQSAIDLVRIEIAKLSAELSDASGDLPSYDQRSYIQAIRELQDKVASAQASLAPKTRFSFKNKRLAAPVSEANSASTSRSVTPTHLRDPDIVSRGKPTPAFASPSAHVLSNQDEDHHYEDQNVEGSSNDDNQWILISSHQGTYLRWPATTTSSWEASSPFQNGKTCVVSQISSCIVDIASSNDKMPSPSALTLKSIDKSLILAPNIRGAAHITSLSRSILVLSCHQFRMHSSHDVDVYLYCHNRPIIEDCSNIRFARIPSLLQASGLGVGSEAEPRAVKQNMFDQVDDFKWLRTEASPNWRRMQDEEGVKEDSWQEVLEALQKLNDEAHKDSTLETVARSLRSLGLGAGS